MSRTRMPIGNVCARRPRSSPKVPMTPQLCSNAQQHQCLPKLTQACLVPTANTQDPQRCHDRGLLQHKIINRIASIYSLSQINPWPAPCTGRTRAPAPCGATFSPPWPSPRTKKPVLAPSSTGDPQRTSVPPRHSRGAEAGFPAQLKP